MKKTSLILSLLALSATLVQAAEYNITLTNAERFTDCTVIYKGSNTTKFRGKNKAGKEVTREVPTNTIIMMREVVKEEEEKTPAEPAAPAEAPAPAPAPEAAKDTPAAPVAEGEKKTEGEPKAEGEEPEPIADGNVAQREGEDKAKDATLRLREKLTSLEALLGKISKPSRSLQSQCNNVKTRVTRQLPDMDKRALEVSKLQDEFNKAGAADYTFDKVSVDQRDQYVRDGEAAYNAMVVDMKEKKRRRKVAGLDKFEIMRDRYQGIPQYKPAYERYIKTLYKLQKSWTRSLEREEAARKRLIPDKRRAMESLDERQYNELAEKLREDGDDIATVWFIPQNRNLKMLKISVNKVKDAIRRNEDRPIDGQSGTVPSLLTQFWDSMDKVRMAMVTGDLDGAEKMLQDNAAFDIIKGLKRELLPTEYKQPLLDQYKDMQTEIRTRKRSYSRLKLSLERATKSLDTLTANAEAQIDSALEAAQRELDTDIGENTMELEKEKKPAPAPADGKPAAPAAPSADGKPAAPAAPATPAAEAQPTAPATK